MRRCDGYTCKHEYGFVVTVGQRIYQDTVKYCKVCETFLKIDGYRCPCCKSNVRAKSHTKKWKIIQKIRKNIQLNSKKTVN